MKTKKRKTFKKIIFILLFVILLPIIILEKIIGSIFKACKKRKFKNDKYDLDYFIENSSIEKIDIMEGYEFENYLKYMFFYLGYKVTMVGGKGDFGADLVIEKNNQKIVVQAKRYTKNLNSSPIREVLGSKVHYKADGAIVVTNSHFTDEAEQLAKENNVFLIDREHLKSLIDDALMVVDQTYKPQLDASEIEERRTDRYRI